MTQVPEPMTSSAAPGNPLLKANTRSALVDFCLALSFANLAFFRVWEIYLSPENDYFGAAVPRLILGAVTIDVLLLAVIGFGVIRVARRAHGKALRAMEWFLFVVVIVFGPQRVYAIQFIDSHLNRLGSLCYFVLAMLLGVPFALWPARVRRFSAAVLLILSPFVLVTISQAAWKIVAPTPATMKDKGPATRFAASPGGRVVWIIFDEMDYTAAFEKRPPNLQLPELDRLRSESWFATNAHPPADGTLISMPALVTGMPLIATRPVTSSDIELYTDTSPNPVRLISQSTIFTDARSRNLNTALIGWYHHYCRVLGDQVVTCADAGQRVDDRGVCSDCAPTLAEAVGDAALRLLPYHTDEMVAYRDHWVQEDGVRTFKRLRSAALSAVSDPTLGLVFIHLPIPHYPFIYSRKTRDFLDRRGSYVDNLALTDETLGELRRAMEQSGVWKNTAVIVTADHWWRYNLYAKVHQLNGDPAIYGLRVPLIIHLPGLHSETTYTKALNNRLLREAVVALLDHPGWSASDFSAWVDANGSRYRWDFVAHMYSYY